MDMDKKLEAAHREIDHTRFETKRLEEEIKFLLDEKGRFYDMNLSKMTKRVLDDPVASEIIRKELGEEFVKESKFEADKCLDGIPIDESQWQSSLDQMVNGVVALCNKQIANYTKLKRLVEEASNGEYSSMAFEWSQYGESIDKSIDVYRRLIKHHSSTKEQFSKF